MRERQVEQDGYVLARGIARGRRFHHRLHRRGTRCEQGQRLGQFNVGCVIGSRTIGDCVLAGIGDNLKFVRARAADGTGIGLDGAKGQPHTGENALVGSEHGVVTLARAGFVAVEGVRVFHGEFAAAHHAKSWTALITEFGLDMIKVHRQLAIALDLIAGDIGHRFLGSRLHNEIPAMTVLHTHEFRPVFLPAARFHPKLSGLDDRH